MTQKLIRTSTLLNPEQLQAVTEIAEGRQVSVASVIREAVREYLARDAAARQDEPVAAVAA